MGYLILKKLKPVVVTCGDPAGAGLDVFLKFLQKKHKHLGRKLRPALIVCPEKILFERAELLGKEYLKTLQRSLSSGKVKLHPLKRNPRNTFISAEIEPGKPSVASGGIAYEAIITAHELIKREEAIAMVTLPISKEWVSKYLEEAGYKRKAEQFRGHTEFLAQLCGSPLPIMVLANPKLKVALYTTHIPLKNVPSYIRKAGKEKLKEFLLVLLREANTLWGPVKIGVAGLNPHAGEGGKFGKEEIEIIKPVIEDLPHTVFSGPHPSDTIFWRAINGEFHIVVAFYHDQGIIPVKTTDFYNGVNITLNLPYVRTSPDHGTAYDIAGTGKADERSFAMAYTWASSLSNYKIPYNYFRYLGKNS